MNKRRFLGIVLFAAILAFSGCVHSQTDSGPRDSAPGDSNNTADKKEDRNRSKSLNYSFSEGVKFNYSTGYEDNRGSSPYVSYYIDQETGSIWRGRIEGQNISAQFVLYKNNYSFSLAEVKQGEPGEHTVEGVTNISTSARDVFYLQNFVNYDQYFDIVNSQVLNKAKIKRLMVQGENVTMNIDGARTYTYTLVRSEKQEFMGYQSFNVTMYGRNGRVNTWVLSASRPYTLIYAQGQGVRSDKVKLESVREFS